MNNRFRYAFFVLMLVGQVVIAKYYRSLRLNVDLLYLVVFYIATKSGFMKSVISASLIGLCSDYLSGGIMGVFSFSRTLAAYLLNTIARFLDLKKNIFVFLLILLSLFLSNVVAYVFYALIFKYTTTTSLLIYQPLATAFIGTVILGLKKVKSLLDVS
ncbi:MAG: rod shape-determining protein MreD [Candidatus Aminicenantes bacterium]|nr:rod shape-determining protein MreD [Candidatus Aminicenantes bacterium]